MGQLRLSPANRVIVILPRILQVGGGGVVFSLSLDCSPPGSSVHGNFQARLLDWVAISSSRGSSQPRDGTAGLLCLLHWQTESLLLSGWYIHQSIIKLFVKHDKLHNCMIDFRNSLWSIKSQRVAALLFLEYTPFLYIVYVFLLVIFVCRKYVSFYFFIFVCLIWG